MITFTQLGRWGHLGNQMYEYAALLGIGHQLGYGVAIPAAAEGALSSHFEITAPILDEEARRKLRHVFHEPRLGYTDRFWAIEDFTDLRSYFQSHRYFPPRAVVLREFRLRPELREEAASFVEPVRRKGRPIVGLTVRRGDYQRNPDLFLQLWNTDFADRALAEFDDLDPIVVVSSDDHEWCRHRFTGERFFFTDMISVGARLGVLTQCDHLIVANSSFAWWAAWLNQRGGRRIAPSRWWGEALEPQRDPLPEGWEALEV